MNKFAPIALVATFTLFSLAPTALRAEPVQSARAEGAASLGIVAGNSLYSAKGSRIASVYRVTQDGRVQVIIDGKLITVPGSTLSEAEGKAVTSLTKAELLRSAR